MTAPRARADAPPMRVAKICGSDVELGNFVLGAGPVDSADFAARALLREIEGVPWSASAVADAGETDPQDRERKFLANGSIYIDLSHVECATAEVPDAWSHVASWQAMLRIVRRARDGANARLKSGLTIEVLANNSDGRHAYGTHTNVMITRRAWQNLFERRMHHLLFLAAYQVSSIVFTGQGKVGAENGASPVNYEISQRADWFETLVGSQTTHHRPIVNARDEALCGGWGDGARADDLARVHSIFFDCTLSHTATVLRVGVLQVVLAMIEAEQVDPTLVLEDPLDALGRFGHDPELRARARTAAGRNVTAIELQEAFLERARRFVADGGCDGIVPRADEIVALWADTLALLRRGDEDALVRRLDWVLKRRLLRRAMERRPSLSWRSADVKMLDHLYASVDEERGLYWQVAASGGTDLLVDEDTIRRHETEPPDDTRAYARAMLLRAAGASRVDHVDWDVVRVVRRTRDATRRIARVDLPDPRRGTRGEVGHLFDGTHDLEGILHAMDARPEPASSAAGSSAS